jgi:hypothetical protein
MLRFDISHNSCLQVNKYLNAIYKYLSIFESELVLLIKSQELMDSSYAGIIRAAQKSMKKFKNNNHG